MVMLETPQKTVAVLDQDQFDSAKKRASLKDKRILLLAFDVPSDPITRAFLAEYRVISSKHFPGLARLGITVHKLR